MSLSFRALAPSYTPLTSTRRLNSRQSIVAKGKINVNDTSPFGYSVVYEAQPTPSADRDASERDKVRHCIACTSRKKVHSTVYVGICLIFARRDKLKLYRRLVHRPYGNRCTYLRGQRGNRMCV